MFLPFFFRAPSCPLFVVLFLSISLQATEPVVSRTVTVEERQGALPPNSVFALTNAPVEGLTLAEALKLVESQQPEIHAARLDIRAAESRVTQAGLRPNPEMSLTAENFGGKGEVARFDSAEYTAELAQTLELGGKRGKRLHTAESERRLAGFAFEAKRLDIRAETTRRFVALQGAQERLALARQSLALAGEFVTAVAARVRAGRISPTDEDKARILLGQQKAVMDSVEQDVKTARVRLAAMWGSVDPHFQRAQGDTQAIPVVPEMAALSARLSANPELARWTMEIEQRKALLAQEIAARAPDVTIAGGVRRFSNTDSQAFVASLSVPLPVFNRNQGKIREAAMLVEKAEQQRRAAQVEIAASLAERYGAFTAALRRSTTLKNDILPRSQTVFDAVQSGYAQGKFAYLDVLDARRAFFDGHADYLEALVSVHQALTELDRLVGGTLSTPEKN